MMQLEFKGRIMTGFLSILILAIAPRASAAGGLPEYMQIDYDTVMAVEVKGVWDDESSVFIATDIEELPQKRRPKLRGVIQTINLKKETITMYGINIDLDSTTQFLDSGQEKFGLRDLKVGLWIEVTCSVDQEGEWEAKKIKLKNIKESNKIKGTITRFHVDGDPPDTLEMHGLLIILTKETDVNYPGSSFEDMELDLFEELSLANPVYSDNGVAAGDRLLIGAEFRQSAESEREYDLSDPVLSDQKNARPEVRLELTGYFNDHVRSFAQARVREMVYLDSQRTNPPSQELDADITQLFVLFRDVGVRGLTLNIGRQDIDEPREWLYDDYLDAARLYYYGKSPFIFEAAYIHSNIQLNRKFRTWTDLFFQGRWQLDKKSSIKAYYLSRKDSDTSRNREPIYYGVGYSGRIRQFLRPWLELAILRGEDKGKTLKASAMDLGATVMASNLPYVPSMTLGYARGSGDKTSADAVTNEFRQTGYQDNVGYFGGVRTLHYYGELLDPELSNLKILTSAIGFRPTANSSLEVIYHTYTQDQLDDKLRGNLIDPPARPNTSSDDLGWGLDFAFGLANLWDRASFVWTFAIFKPGEAFSPYTNTATSNKLNLKVEL